METVFHIEQMGPNHFIHCIEKLQNVTLVLVDGGLPTKHPHALKKKKITLTLKYI